MRRLVLFTVLVLLGLSPAGVTSGQLTGKNTAADSPYLTYEGVLTDPSGVPLSGEYLVTFRIYDSPSAPDPLWEETHRVAATSGEFRVVLGNVTPLPASDLGSRYIGVQVDGEELMPRHRIGGDGIAGKDPVPVGGGPGALPYFPVDAMDGRYVNVVGDTMSGDLYVDTKIGVGTRVPTSKLEVQGSDLALPIVKATNLSGGTALSASSSGNSASLTTGVYGYGSNTSTGSAYGGRFITSSSGTGGHTGVDAEGFSASSSTTYGVFSLAQNTGSGEAYGGLFSAPSAGTGTRYGSRSEGSSASNSGAYGAYGYAENISTGNAFGGRFYVASTGTGTHYGIFSNGYGAASAATYGVYATADNTSDGAAYGGYFQATPSGTGAHYGLYADAPSSSISNNYGCFASASNSSSGWTYAGYFNAPTGGTGRHYGIRTVSNGASAQVSYGIDSYAENTSTGPAYAGSFYVAQSGTGTHIGVSTSAFANGAGWSYGTNSSATNSGTGNAYGGYFMADNLGTGTHYGVYGVESAGGTGAAVYAAGDMIASGAKPAVVRTSQGHRLLYAQESPEVWFEDFGEGRLLNGKIHIDLDPLFLETVVIDDAHPIKVFVQLNDENCRGTAVHRGSTGFDVVELAGGTSSASFSYRVVAKRKGYEDERLRLTDAGHDDPNLYPELWTGIEERMSQETQDREETRRQQLEEQRRREAEGRVEPENRLHEEISRIDTPEAIANR